MRMKVSNYISEMLVKAGIHQAFMVTGGGAMHLDDALGHQKAFTVSMITMSRPAL